MEIKRKCIQTICLIIFYLFSLALSGCLIPQPIHDLQINSPSDASVPVEVELGKKIFEELKTQLEFTDNPLIQAYIDKMANKILQQVPPNRFTFRYFIIKSDQLNAFALPNGYICLTERLLNSVKTENELAFVLCHETAHVTQTHFRRLMEKKSKVDVATMAAMVAGLLLAKDTELQTAIQAFSLGTNQTFLLKYSKEFENEADEIGFNYLIQAGYQGKGASDFMETLHNLDRITIIPPAYLSTHPPTNDRIYHLEQLAKKSPSAASLVESAETKSIDNFRRFQIWNRIESEHPQDYLKDLQQDYQNHPKDPDVLYGLALIFEKLGKTEESMNFFKKCLSHNSNDSDALRDFGIFLFRQGNYEKAEKYLRLTTKINSKDFLALHYLGRTLKEKNLPDKAINHLIQSKELKPDFPENYYYLGSLYQQKGQLKEAHQNFGTHFSLKGNKKAANFHFKEAER